MCIPGIIGHIPQQYMGYSPSTKLDVITIRAFYFNIFQLFGSFRAVSHSLLNPYFIKYGHFLHILIKPNVDIG